MIIDSYPKLKQFLSQKKEKKPTLLLHCCCAPCSSYVLDFLKESFAITIFYYNPNIYPQNEYKKRLHEFSKLQSFPFIEGFYEPNVFYETVKGLENIPEGGERCFSCIHMRLKATAEIAMDNGFDYFSTTLSISPYKNSKKINEIGNLLSREYNVKYLYSNFKKEDGYKKSIILSKNLDLYRQNYCGCEFSLRERQEKINK